MWELQVKVMLTMETMPSWALGTQGSKVEHITVSLGKNGSEEEMTVSQEFLSDLLFVSSIAHPIRESYDILVRMHFKDQGHHKTD